MDKGRAAEIVVNPKSTKKRKWEETQMYKDESAELKADRFQFLKKVRRMRDDPLGAIGGDNELIQLVAALPQER